MSFFTRFHQYLRLSNKNLNGRSKSFLTLFLLFLETDVKVLIQPNLPKLMPNPISWGRRITYFEFLLWEEKTCIYIRLEAIFFGPNEKCTSVIGFETTFIFVAQQQ